MIEKKEVQQNQPNKKEKEFNLNLARIYHLIKQKIPPSHINEKGEEEDSICSIMNFSKTRLSRYLKILDNSGFTEKRGLIRVILKDFDINQVQHATRVADNDPLTLSIKLSKYPKNMNRGHGFRFKVLLKSSIKNWNNENRTEILTKLGFNPWQLTHLIGGGQGILYKGRKIHITNRSIIIFENASYISRFSRASDKYAVADMKDLVRKIEKSMRANLFNDGKIRFRVLKRHHAIIKNSLAKQYNRNNKKLEVYTDRGLTFLIDDSLKLEEFEGVHKDTSDSDMDDKVIPFFQSLDKDPTTTTEIKENFNEFRSMIKQISADQLQVGQVLDQLSKNQIKIIKKLKDIGV